MMGIQNIIYELLYLGIKTEIHRRWKGRYIKTLKKHIFDLNELQKSLYTSKIDTSRTAIKKFIEDCGVDYEISKCYPILSNTQIDDAVMEEDSKKMNQVIKEMFADLVIETKKIFINKKKITKLLYVLQNLLETYLGKSRRKRLVGWTEESIPELWALTAAASTMNDEMREKYLHEEKYLNFISDNIYKKVYEDSQTKEIIYCPICDKKLSVLRSDDWTILHSAACNKCGFYIKYFYSY
ncbi:MAG: hypothetical protein K2N44_16560 [Lachnospiraceae bacterium]|nr:hypothetical protein [Lachnospiraceae bacterium]